MAQQSVTGSGQPGLSTVPREHAMGDVAPVRELPYRPAATGCITGRTDGSTRLRTTLTNRLHPKGRPQMESGRIQVVITLREREVATMGGSDPFANVVDGGHCVVVSGTHSGKSGVIRDRNTSATGHVTITVEQADGVRFKTLARNVSTQA